MASTLIRKSRRQYAVERANDYIVRESSSLSYRTGLLRCGKLGNKVGDTVNYYWDRFVQNYLRIYLLPHPVLLF